MKKIIIISAAVAALAQLASCTREDYASNVPGPASGKAKTLTASFAPGETKTFFDGSDFKWNSGDAILVRSDNEAGYTQYSNTTGESAGKVTFEASSEDEIIYGDLSYAVYPNTVQDGCPKIEEGILQLYSQTNYTWSEGSVQAPMIAKVASGEDLQFTHMGGLLKVTYKNVPPKARYIKVSAPIDDTHYYKISQTMGPVGMFGWQAGVGFVLEKPFFKAYNDGGTNEYSVKIDINSATAAQRTSTDGITAYVPLPVGPVEDSGKNVYPTLNICLTFADGSTVPGSAKSAENVQIERAHIKPMPAISLDKYTTESFITGLARSPHDIIALPDGRLVATGENYHVYFIDVNAKTATQSAVKDGSKYPQYPYGVCYVGGNLYIANKNSKTTYGIYRYDMSTELYSQVATGYNQSMQIKEYNGSVYLLCRGDSSTPGKIYVFPNGVPGEVTAELYADFAGIASSGHAWPLSFAFDTDGSMIVAISASSGSPTECFKLYKVASKGATPVALFGNGTKAGSYDAITDGLSASASFAPDIQDMELDGSGNLYIADQYCIRKLVRGTSGFEDGTIVTLTEKGVLPRVDGLAFDSTYTHIYVTNKSSKCIYKVTIE